MKRTNKFAGNRNMAEMQMEQFQRELNVLAQKLHEKEQQLSVLTHQGQNQVSQMQAQLQEVLQKLENRELEIVQLQIQMAETPELHDTTPEIKNYFACGRVPDIIKGPPSAIFGQCPSVKHLDSISRANLKTRPGKCRDCH